jgi:hypothetical protein
MNIREILYDAYLNSAPEMLSAYDEALNRISAEIDNKLAAHGTITYEDTARLMEAAAHAGFTAGYEAGRS